MHTIDDFTRVNSSTTVWCTHIYMYGCTNILQYINISIFLLNTAEVLFMLYSTCSWRRFYTCKFVHSTSLLYRYFYKATCTGRFYSCCSISCSCRRFYTCKIVYMHIQVHVWWLVTMHCSRIHACRRIYSCKIVQLKTIVTIHCTCTFMYTNLHV